MSTRSARPRQRAIIGAAFVVLVLVVALLWARTESYRTFGSVALRGRAAPEIFSQKDLPSSAVSMARDRARRAALVCFDALSQIAA
jgi:hypothetical protein